MDGGAGLKQVSGLELVLYIVRMCCSTSLHKCSLCSGLGCGSFVVSVPSGVLGAHRPAQAVALTQLSFMSLDSFHSPAMSVELSYITSTQAHDSFKIRRKSTSSGNGVPYHTACRYFGTTDREPAHLSPTALSR